MSYKNRSKQNLRWNIFKLVKEIIKTERKMKMISMKYNFPEIFFWENKCLKCMVLFVLPRKL